jgi:5-methylcytosine-specific restriction endonuclease McrA
MEKLLMKEWYQEQVVGPVREIAKMMGTKRSGKWIEVRTYFVEEHPTCAVCGTKKKLNVHHIVPFHLRPDLEMDESNLITLCRKHHFTFGHLGYWRSWNTTIVEDAKVWLQKYKNRPVKRKGE